MKTNGDGSWTVSRRLLQGAVLVLTMLALYGALVTGMLSAKAEVLEKACEYSDARLDEHRETTEKWLGSQLKQLDQRLARIEDKL